MRCLIVGSSPVLNTSLACHLVRTWPDASIKWQVITSYQSSIASYTACDSVASVMAYKDLGSEEPSRTASSGWLWEVVANSFFEKAWVKQRLRETSSDSGDLLVVSPSPLNYLDKAVLSRFDRVYLTKTGISDKQTQYYTLFADSSTVSFDVFKKLLRDLATNEYAFITYTGGQPGPFTKKQYVAVWEAGAAATAVAATTTTTRRAAVVAPEPVPAVARPEVVTAVDAGQVELWLSLQVKPSVTLEDVVTNMRAMLGQELIATMLHTQLYQTHAETHRVQVYVQVFEHRQDLFASLALNMLQSLRQSGLVLQGALVI